MSNRLALLAVIPPRTVGSLARWVFKAIPPGGFVTAVLQGDLFQAVARADDDNRRALVQIVQLISWSIPNGCYAHDDPIREWSKTKYDNDRDALLANPQYEWLKDYLNA